MRKIFDARYVIFVIFLLSCVRPGLCTASEKISSTELIANAKKNHGRQVVYQGEVIGEVMKRGEFAWVNLHDGENAIGVWVPVNLTKNIIYTGSYKAKGDIFEASGVFNRSCPEHGGDLDIHAKIFTKISSGGIVPEVVKKDKRNKALILFGVLLLWILILLLRR